MRFVETNFDNHFAEKAGLVKPSGFHVSPGEERDARRLEDDRPIYPAVAAHAGAHVIFDSLEFTTPQNGVQLNEVVQPTTVPEMKRDRTARIPYTFAALSGLSNVAKRRKGQQ